MGGQSRHRKEEIQKKKSLNTVFFRDREFAAFLKIDPTPEKEDFYRNSKDRQDILAKLSKLARRNESLQSVKLDHEFLQQIIWQHLKYATLPAKDFPDLHHLLGSSGMFWWWLAQYISFQEEFDSDVVERLMREVKHRSVSYEERLKLIADMDKLKCEILKGQCPPIDGASYDESFDGLPLSLRERIQQLADDTELFRDVMLAQKDHISVYQGFVTIDEEQLKNKLHTKRCHQKSILRRSVHWCFTLDPHIAEHFSLAFNRSALVWAAIKEQASAGSFLPSDETAVSSFITSAKAFMGRPTVGKFRVAKSDVILTNNGREEQEIVVNPKNAELVGYQFIAPSYNENPSLWERILQNAPRRVDVYVAMRCQERLERKNKNYKRSIALERVTRNSWRPSTLSKFANDTNTTVSQLILSNPAMHR